MARAKVAERDPREGEIWTPISFNGKVHIDRVSGSAVFYHYVGNVRQGCRMPISIFVGYFQPPTEGK
jgi:hypothetical protein